MLNDYRPLARNRDFLVSLAGRCASRFGDEVALVALTLRVQAAGGRPYVVALLLAAGLVPSIAAAGLAGRVADSADSRRVLVTATAAQACCCVPLIFTHQMAAMIILVALLGTGAAFSQATWQALIPRVAGEQHIGTATALQQTAFTLSTILAPAVAGILAGAFGTGLPLALDAATFGLMTAAALAVRTRRGGARGRGAAGPERGGGWAALRRDPLLSPLIVGLAAFVLLGMMVNVVGVFLVIQALHASAAWYGGLEAITMIGLAGGVLACGRITTDAGRARAVAGGAALMSLAMLGFGTAPVVLVLVPLGLLAGVGNGMVNVCVATLVMTRTEERMRGRVAAALGAVLNAASVASLVAGGALAAVLAPRQVYLLAGGLGCVVTAVLAARCQQRPSTARSVLPGRRRRAWHTGPIAASTGALPQVESRHGSQLRHLYRYFVRQ
jgi:MFS family permease